jgi:hypothetical protein
MLRLGSFGLIGIDADEQRTLGLRSGLRSSQNAERGEKRGNVPFHTYSATKLP